MREIKFRAWDKVEKVMYNIAYPTCLGVEVYIENHGNYEEFSIGECELMQYTGVKDFTGREVYEGDLYEDDENMLWVVEFENGKFVLNNVYMIADFDIVNISKYSTYKCIGNIYENSDLLEE